MTYDPRRGEKNKINGKWTTGGICTGHTKGQDLSRQKERLAGCDEIFEEKTSGPVRPSLGKAMHLIRARIYSN